MKKTLIHTSKLPNICHCSILQTLTNITTTTTTDLPQAHHPPIDFLWEKTLLHKWRTPLQRDHNNDFNALLVASRSAGPYIVGSFKVPLLKEIVCHLVDTSYSSVLLLSTSSNLMFQFPCSTNTLQANTLDFLVLLVELAYHLWVLWHMQIPLNSMLHNALFMSFFAHFHTHS
jgi:hypothetical protein